MADGADRETFAQRVGQTLDVVGSGDSALPLRVDRVEDYGSVPGRRFSAFLRGPEDRPLRQGIHTIGADDKLFDVFLVPVGREAGQLEYEVAFNRDGS